MKGSSSVTFNRNPSQHPGACTPVTVTPASQGAAEDGAWESNSGLARRTEQLLPVPPPPSHLQRTAQSTPRPRGACRA